MAAAQATLDRANEEAWQLYGRVCSRFAVDFNVVPELLRHLVDGWPSEDVIELMERFAVMYDVFNPPTQRQD
jgi:hypothetical protein